MKKAILLTVFVSIVVAATLLGACSSGPQPTAENPVPGKAVKSAPIGDGLMVTISSETGKLKGGEQEIFLSFTDPSGKAVDVGMVKAAALNFRMPAMGSMSEMNSSASFTTTSVPGVYMGKVDIEMKGEWQAQISFEGDKGKGQTTMSVTAQ
ncbi:MAG: FixH family protein [Pyrinomonadaceae bacterium]